MTASLQLLRGNDSALDTYVGNAGELLVSTTDNRPRVFDGVKAGGFQLALKEEAIPALQITTRRSFIWPAATFTSLSYAANSGNVQLSSAGVHGLTTSPAVGCLVEVVFPNIAAGAKRLYPVVSVDSTTAITIGLAHSAGFGTPVATVAGSDLISRQIAFPANFLKNNAYMQFKTAHTKDAGSGATFTLRWGGVYVDDNGISANQQISPLWTLANRGSKTSQSYTYKDAFLKTVAVDTTVDNVLQLELTAAAANQVVTEDLVVMQVFNSGT